MAKGNQSRRGAVSKDSRRNAPPKLGSGGKHRRALSGKGPTPKAEDRTWHPAYKAKVAKEKEAEKAALREKSLTRSAVRVRPGSELIVGRNPVVEAVNAGTKVSRIFIASDPSQGKMREVFELLAQTNAPFVEVTKRDLDRVSDGAAHQGIAVEVDEYEYVDLEDLIIDAKQQYRPGLLIALDHVTDPHNVGAILRSGAAFGANGMILPERRSAGVGVTAWKVSAGAAARVPTARVTNLVQALRKLKEEGFFVVGLAGDGDGELRNMGLADRDLVLVAGAEGSGLSRLVRDTCDMIVSIPMTSNVESLNASVATSVALYEIAATRAEAR
ncbi:23S rRNA (guanosine(2251)-2'-O)-methyltransferase RlmB [Actinomyces minihominis]|uniref:23S rRNA (guanosine(2251)-2'-O)-methyltransferase RlmB n=1 Tax=Actinomyces minihominis TaxID=2002838 RepID=UPI000C0838F9|nr:23S rRNA (guanosine(2251)-2'-O)-methyltransferase RlmB [Actinomyces minihominis]